MIEITKSVGHLAFIDDKEYIESDGDVYSTELRLPLLAGGRRGGYWEFQCRSEDWERRRLAIITRRGVDLESSSQSQ